MNHLVRIEEDDNNRILSIPHLQNSIYHNLDIVGTLDFFMRRYVHPLSRLFDISKSVVVDCGSGYGWFSIAYLLAGGKFVFAVDVETDRLSAAKMIARILSVDDRMQFIASSIQNIPLSSDEVDIFVSIETLEHIGKKNIKIALQRIKEITSYGILITTPNKFFPVIAHDTHLPFAHWLPGNLRMRYAKAFGRENMNANNDFLSPLDFNQLLDKFSPASSCLVFENYKEYRKHYPFYLPYGSDEQRRFQTRPNVLKSTYYQIASMIVGHYSYWVMPSLAHIFVRK